MREEYKKYVGIKDKELRRETASPRLVTKRFLLSDNPELKRLIKDFHRVTEELKEKHPEIVSFGFFGSLTKGYAMELSDIDIYVFIDEEEWEERGYPTLDQEKIEYRFEYKIQLRQEFSAALGVTEDRVKDLMLKVLNKKEIYDTCIVGDAFENWPLFLLNTSRDIEEYRKIVLDILQRNEELEPGSGERPWKWLIHKLFEFENQGLEANLQEERRKLYPRTLAEARKKFLSRSDVEEIAI